MAQQTVTHDRPDAGVLSDRPQSRSALTFFVGFGIASMLTLGATLGLLTGQGLASQSNASIGWMLVGALVICAGLGGILAHRLIRIARAWRAEATGARLHLRFVTLFSLAALAPAVIVAAFLGFTFSQGLESWFSPRVETTIENAASVGSGYTDLVSHEILPDVRAMGADMNAARRGMVDDPDRYGRFLITQAQGRNFTSAYVIDRTGHVLARAQSDSSPRYAPPTEEAFATADQGTVSTRFDESTNSLVALIKLPAYGNAYLGVTRQLEPGRVARLLSFRRAVLDYRAARDRQGSLRVLFGLAYFATAILVLLAAIWVGLSSASRVAEPIGRLANAARRVASGDLKARVAVNEERDEIDALATAFNGMTAQLETQRRELVAAQEEAETRSRFIEAVLGGVSAGVVGLDRDGRITATNRSAGQLLGHGTDTRLVGRRLVDVAPEFAELLNQPAPVGESPPHRVDLIRD
ncbi:MAG: HAMP domain-containing protein, partial [Proteobacteria bacterium]|nr:HAMP domain-containing protein [Pseudomonadota bacterium]